MAAAVMSPMSNLTLDGGIMPPSPVSGNNSRHGRSRHGGSVAKGNKTRGRGYSIVEDRESMVIKALTFVMKRTVTEDEEQAEGDEKLVADSEGWVDVDDFLAHPNIATLELSFPELQDLSTSSKAKFLLKSSETASSDPSDFTLRLKPSSAARPDSPTSSKSNENTPLTLSSPDLPALIVYETSYANYPLILASGGIKRAGGQANLVFSGIQVLEDGTEVRPQGDSDVSIYLDFKAVLAADDKITWAKTESGSIVTAGDAAGVVPKALWKKAVARRADIGVLFEDGEVRKEVPIGLRGKGVKPGKRGGGKGKGKGLKDLKRSSEDEGSASD